MSPDAEEQDDKRREGEPDCEMEIYSNATPEGIFIYAPRLLRALNGIALGLSEIAVSLERANPRIEPSQANTDPLEDRSWIHEKLRCRTYYAGWSASRLRAAQKDLREQIRQRGPRRELVAAVLIIQEMLETSEPATDSR